MIRSKVTKTDKRNNIKLNLLVKRMISKWCDGEEDNDNK